MQFKPNQVAIIHILDFAYCILRSVAAAAAAASVNACKQCNKLCNGKFASISPSGAIRMRNETTNNTRQAQTVGDGDCERKKGNFHLSFATTKLP